MRILSWNVQYGKSCDGVFALSRTLQYIKSLGEFDIICLQELARHLPDYVTDTIPDQLATIKETFNDYSVVWGAGFSWPATSGQGGRQEFGNATLVRGELQDFKVHQLPFPATPGSYQMQRIALETIVPAGQRAVSIINTHLAFHDSNENLLQVERLCQLDQDRAKRYHQPGAIGHGAYKARFPAFSGILCGDFNFTPDTHQYRYQIDAGWIDAWRSAENDASHPATCGIFDHDQWPQGAHCRDYFWLSPELENSAFSANVDASSNLSDHQPIVLEISF